MENFINCKGYECIYQISELGNVKSLSRYIENGNGGYFSKEKILNPTLNKVNGYLYVTLCKNNKCTKKSVHQLVAINFLGCIPDGTNKIVVDHIDNNKLNNNLLNLQLITNRMNCSKLNKGSSKYIGVYFYKKINRFRARIRIEGKRKELGQFKTEIEAHNAYQIALLEI
jgi:hypothetical protein